MNERRTEDNIKVHDQQRHESFGAALDHYMQFACATWRKIHHPGKEWQRAYTEDIKIITCVTNHYQEGRVKIHVEIKTIKPQERETFWFELIRGLDGTYELEHKA